MAQEDGSDVGSGDSDYFNDVMEMDETEDYTNEEDGDSELEL